MYSISYHAKVKLKSFLVLLKFVILAAIQHYNESKVSLINMQQSK